MNPKRLTKREEAYLKFAAWGMLHITTFDFHGKTTRSLLQRGLLVLDGTKLKLAGGAVRLFKHLEDRFPPKPEPIAMHRTRPVRKEL